MKKLGYMLALSLLLAGCVNDGKSDDTAKITKPLSEKEAIHTQEEAIQDSTDEVQKEVESDESNEVSDTVPENKDIIEEPAEQVERADDSDETSKESGISESSEEPVSEVKTKKGSEEPAAEVKRKKSSEQAPIVKEPAASPKNEETTSEEKKESAPVKSEKAKYLNKLANVKASISEFEKQLESGTQVEMGQAYGEIFKRWDREMNDIYGALKNQLPVSEMNKLRAEQRNWLIYRDKTAKEASVKYEGGTMASLEYVATQARLTEERSYELVEAYMY
ncbi:lysozyme inhibitor LprI family protein [Pseudobacillus sp. 179-B 2D1 NHS]|uniref:lysozyme inhibitor LprI family protein n=1 Tax=Pseudobacillus sp. 179-B 2D1 NHS TaxID=3374292 RepID=UPI00387A28A9